MLLNMSKPTTVRIPGDLRDRIDAARGDVSQARWVQRALESCLAVYEAGQAEGVPLVLDERQVAGPPAFVPGRGSPSPSLARHMGRPPKGGKS
jgi:hypothetical protein